ncbi:IS66 family transposase (plasmid) [Acaryochloris sp. 'Moss Beach']|nr:IS66 family transposase [Acaryochloris sp. 'Moss Beach']UJB72517.1 IS66 family transposase [Acaryochloris sp. 'Moss Beach']
MSESDIRAIYHQGEDAVVELVTRLIERIERLEERLDKDSRNSSKPPSGDGFGKRTKSLRGKSKRKSGGQKGHPGRTLEWRETVDAVVLHPVTQCQECGTSLTEVAPQQYDLRQVHELPPLSLQVIEHQAEVKYCEHCQTLSRGVFPADVTNVVQYGSSLKGLMVYLMDAQLLPFERTSELLKEVFGCQVSEGTLCNARTTCAQKLEPIEVQIKDGIEQAAIGHFDEAGLRVNSKLWWLHVACTSGLTYYFVHAKRGKAAMDEMDILPNFTGTSIHDGWQSYATYDCAHGLCNAHHLRELRFIVEHYQQPWAEEMMTLLVDIKTQVESAHAEGLKALSTEQIEMFEQRYRKVLADGFKSNPILPVDENAPKKRGKKKQSTPKNLLDRFEKYQSAVLAFMYDFQVPFDNNQTERDIRMMKLKQKISGCFRSLAGAQQFCRIRGYISTLRKQDIPVLDSLRSIFVGTPVLPMLQPGQ